MPTWVLTGANRGLGLEFVRQLSSSSSNTIFAGIRSLSASHPELQSLVSSAHATIHIYECQTSSRDSILGFASKISQTLKASGGRVDFLLNNAGINANPDVPVLGPADTASTDTGEELTPLPATPITADMLNEHMAVNVLGPTILATALDPHLGGGSVVMNMTSGLGSLQKTLEMKPRKCPVYSMSKAALDMVSLQMASEWEARGKKVVVVVMDPGWVKTRMGGEGAVLEAEESIGGMLKVLRGLKEGDSGRFFAWSGEEIPW